jgi:hypothetical protein
LTGCGSTWYGTGIVKGKSTIDNEVVITCGTQSCPSFKDYCLYLKIEDKRGVDHEGCVSERVWDDAMIDHQITITKEYN